MSAPFHFSTTDSVAGFIVTNVVGEVSEISRTNHFTQRRFHTSDDGESRAREEEARMAEATRQLQRRATGLGANSILQLETWINEAGAGVATGFAAVVVPAR